MLRSEIATLLGMCATFDRRTVGQTDVEAWYAVLGNYSFDEGRQGLVQHYSVSREWIMPSDVIAGMRSARALALPKASPPPDADPDDVPAYLDALRAGRVLDIEPGDGATIEPIGEMPRRNDPACEIHPDQAGRLCRSCAADRKAADDE